MQSDEKLWEICKEIYREMFKDANPSADFDGLVKSGKAKEKDFFMKYYLPVERQTEIVDRICNDHKIRGYDKRKISHEVHLGSSPNSSKKTWKKAIQTKT